ncbi:CHAT domain-containing protein [Archangium lansingense]|uniref:CHAT domain-containing protein n=1 Tax=Archangium lansingense TaxID=2995310 RepID=UPI003B80EC6C
MSEEPNVFFDLGTLCLENHRSSEAIKHFQRALELASGIATAPEDWRSARDSKCLSGIGVAYGHLQQYEESWRYQELAHQRCRFNPHPLIQLAVLSARKNEPVSVRTFLAEAIPLMKDSPYFPDVKPLKTYLLTAPELEKYRGVVIYLLHRHGKVSQRAYELLMRLWQEGRLNRLETSFDVDAETAFTRQAPGGMPSEGFGDVFLGGLAGPKEEGLEVIRYGQLGFPARVPLQRPQALRITINRQPAQDEEGQVALHLFARQWPMKVVATLVNVRPEDFLVEGASSGVIEVPKDGDSEPLVFVLVPQSPGPKTVRVRFEQDNTFVTTARIHTEVIERAQAEPGQAMVEAAPAIEPRGLPPNFTLYIERDAERTYSISVCTGDSDPGVPAWRVGELTFEQEGSPGLYMRTRFEELDATVTSGVAAARYADAVERLGNNLYQKLFIRGGLDSFYWEQMYPRSKQRAGGAEAWSAPTVQIVSDEPYIPWELLRPYRDTGQGIEVDPLFFCERFALARWLDVQHSASSLDLFKVALVVPPSNLGFVQEEVDAFERMQREGRMKVERIESKEALDTFLTRGGAHVVHFACHGRFEQEQPGRSLVMLGSHTSLRPDDVTGKYLAFGRSRPLVFLNACDTARQSFGLTGLEGWAETFVRTAGVGGFIGSTWQATDELACRFAISFYELLSKGLPLGEAMRRARMAIKSSGDATYLSYALYANPRARVRRAAV